MKLQEFYVDISVTFDGSLRLLNRVFTNSLYDPTSQDFKDMEQEFCQTVSFQTFYDSNTWGRMVKNEISFTQELLIHLIHCQ